MGCLVLAGAVWVLIGEQLAGASSDAVVNARLHTMRSPMVGQITMKDRTLGSYVRRNEELATVNDPRADRARLQDLVMEKTIAGGKVRRLAGQIEAIQAAIDTLDGRTTRFRTGRLRELELMLTSAGRRLSILEGAASAIPDGTSWNAEAASLRPDALIETAAERWSRETARERVATLENALEAARDGVYLGDGYNDAPFSAQRRTELDDRRGGLEIEAAEAGARLEAVESRLNAERIRVSQLAEAGLPAPVTGQVWTIISGNGAHVERGDPVLQLLDCNSLFVTLSVTETVFNTLSVGDAAEFRLASDGRVFAATISRLAGAGATRIYEALAVSPSPAHLQRFDVALFVPGLADAEGLSCPVGRTGRVFFERRPLDWLRWG